MSNAPPQHTTVVVNQQSASALGLSGLIFSVLGWFTCGLLCIPGALLSFFGLFSSKPKGYAIAGLLVGFPGVLFFFFVGMSMLLGFLGIGAAGMATVAEAQRQVELQDVTTALETEAEAAGSEAELLEPLASDAEVAELTASDEDDVAEPAEAVADIEPTQAQIETQPEPAVAPEVRTFSDASGRFSVEATLLAVKDGKAKLKREDNGKELVVEISKLSQADQEWINSWNLE